jgi:hypothetical protein
LDALLGPAADHPRGRAQLGGGKLGGALGELVGGGAEARHDDAAEEASVGGDAVECRRRAEVHHDRVRVIELHRGQGVDDPIGADAQRFVHVEPDRERRVGIDLHARAARHPLDAGHHGQGDRGRDGRQADGPHLVGRVPRPEEKPADGAAPFVGRAAGIGGEAPVRLELRAPEEPHGDLGVADVERQQHDGRSAVT